MRNKISLVELKVRVKDFKKEILMIKNQGIRIWYQPEIVNRISFIGAKEYLNLIYFLGIFGKILNENNDLKKFKYRLWKISLKDDGKIIFHSVNKYSKKEIFLNIDLETRKSFVLSNKNL